MVKQDTIILKFVDEEIEGDADEEENGSFEIGQNNMIFNIKHVHLIVFNFKFVIL